MTLFMCFAISIHFIPYKLQPASKIWSWGRRWDDDLWRPASKKFKKRQMGQRKIRRTSRLRSLSKVPSMGFYWSRFVCRFNELLSSHVTCDKENASMRFARKAGKKVSPTFEGGFESPLSVIWSLKTLLPCPSMGPKWFWTVQITLDRSKF